MTADLADGEERTLIDLPGEYSHEYFPRVTADGEWLIWGASSGGHEHDRADYEIFVWKIDSPWETATRVTYSPGNDQWPDLFHRIVGALEARPPRRSRRTLAGTPAATENGGISPRTTAPAPTMASRPMTAPSVTTTCAPSHV